MTQHDNILIVPVPEDARGFRIHIEKVDWLFFWTKTGWDDIDSQQLPPGTWRIVGRFKELTEDDWHKIIGGQLKQMPYPDFELVFNWFDTATESGMSLLRSKGIDPESNPIILKKEVV